MFTKHYEQFFAFNLERVQTSAKKLEILVDLVTDSNKTRILEELTSYIL
jgi:vesicle coat complex subunit